MRTTKTTPDGIIDIEPELFKEVIDNVAYQFEVYIDRDAKSHDANLTIGNFESIDFRFDEEILNNDVMYVWDFIDATDADKMTPTINNVLEYVCSEMASGRY